MVGRYRAGEVRIDAVWLSFFVLVQKAEYDVRLSRMGCDISLRNSCCILKYVGAYIRTYIRTYVRTYVHTYVRTHARPQARTRVRTYVEDNRFTS